MFVKKAAQYFLGKAGYRTMNCAQAVHAAFKEYTELPEDVVRSFSRCGGGQAPEGLCGALYAAETILKSVAPQNVAECRTKFTSAAGGMTCKQVRQLKKLSCAQCVEAVVTHLTPFCAQK